ncbi:MAG: FliO/MopB family protein [bacterium]|nr:FliO/MopB family protein [bacterium]
MSDLRPLRRMKKTVVSAFVIAVLLSTVAIGDAGEPASRPATQPAVAPAPRFPVQSYGEGDDLNGLMWQMLSASLVVLVIGGVALFVIKRLLPRIKYTSHKRITVLETVYLGSRKTVHLLQVGSVKLLVASSPEGVVKLDDVTHAFDVQYTDVAQRVESQADKSNDAADESGKGGAAR